MSSPRSREERIVAYVTKALRQNPFEQSASIVRRRNRLLGLLPREQKTQAQPDTASPLEARKRLQAEIDRVRKAIWKDPIPELSRALAALDTDRFPDLGSSVRRLQTIVGHRDRFPGLTAHKDFDGDFFEVFREVLAASPRESAMLKEKVLVRFGKRRLRKKGTRMIRLIQRELPQLYELESDWLGTLTRRRPRQWVVSSSIPEIKTSSSGASIPWWVWLVLIGVLRTIARLAGSGE